MRSATLLGQSRLATSYTLKPVLHVQQQRKRNTSRTKQRILIFQRELVPNPGINYYVRASLQQRLEESHERKKRINSEGFEPDPKQQLGGIMSSVVSVQLRAFFFFFFFFSL